MSDHAPCFRMVNGIFKREVAPSIVGAAVWMGQVASRRVVAHR